MTQQKKTYSVRAKSKATGFTKKSPSNRSVPGPIRGTPHHRLDNSQAVYSSKTTVLPFTISDERKLDILGVIIMLIGFLTLIGVFSTTKTGIAAWWASLVSKAIGWGGVFLAILLLGIGGWLVIRKIDRIPPISMERLTGLVFLFFNILAFLHVFAGGLVNAELVSQAAKGGGVVGGVIVSLLNNALGGAGAVIVLLAWLIISLTMALDLSVQEIFSWLFKTGKDTSGWIQSQAVRRPEQTTEPVEEESGLDPDFIPLTTMEPVTAAETATPEGNPSTDAGHSAPAGGVEIPQPRRIQKPETIWKLPEAKNILDNAKPMIENDSSNSERAHLIEETLASFGAPGHVVEISRGPTVTMFGVEPDFIDTRSGHTRVRVGKIVSLADDLALALAATRIRIQAPVPGRNYVGIEVPNEETSLVALREIIESPACQKIKSPLKFALGKSVSGNPVAADLASMPHLLIAGTTGSGKSVCVNGILSCLLMNNKPDDLRMILIDPKRVELTPYNGIPHLLAPVVVDADRVVGALQWMIREMDSRYHKFAQSGARNISDYNKKMETNGEKKLPYLVILIDELADLMMLAPDETERTITRLAQMARATGIHMILATQRPSVDVITGLIKANFPARIAFAVASGVDSRVILDQPGAERLLGRGDMLFQAPDAPAPVRLQGVYVSDAEIQRLVSYWRTQMAAEPGETQPGETQSDDGAEKVSEPPVSFLKQEELWSGLGDSQEEDPMLNEVIELVRREGRASISMLQRRLRIGYSRAARMIDRLEAQGIIGAPQANTQVRQVLDYGQTAPPKEE
jgi:S-DNA-T family DNA segregation ATPase FtsK/SpoIIIE